MFLGFTPFLHPFYIIFLNCYPILHVVFNVLTSLSLVFTPFYLIFWGWYTLRTHARTDGRTDGRTNKCPPKVKKERPQVAAIKSLKTRSLTTKAQTLVRRRVKEDVSRVLHALRVRRRAAAAIFYVVGCFLGVTIIGERFCAFCDLVRTFL